MRRKNLASREEFIAYQRPLKALNLKLSLCLIASDTCFPEKRTRPGDRLYQKDWNVEE